MGQGALEVNIKVLNAAKAVNQADFDNTLKSEQLSFSFQPII